MTRAIFFLIVFSVLTSLTQRAPAQAQPNETRTWTLSSGGAELRLRFEGGELRMAYLGPSGRPDWRPKKPANWATAQFSGRALSLSAEGREIGAGDLVLRSARREKTGRDASGDALRLVLGHRDLPLEIEIQYTAWSDTGAFSAHMNLHNRGSRLLRIDAAPSLGWQLPAGRYELSYLWGGWGRERQLASEKLGAGRRVFSSQRGRSSNGYSPWFMLHDSDSGTRYAAQLAWSGNWETSFELYPQASPLEETPLKVAMGMSFDRGKALLLAPEMSVPLPEAAFTASDGDLDDAANRLHRYQSRYVLARTPANDPLLVQFNSWYPFPGKMTVAEMKRVAEVAAELGAEVFVLDAGWFNRVSWSKELGDWNTDPVAFPNGLGELARHVHSKGMKFGLWVEIENLGSESRMFRERAAWCLSRDGKPVQSGSRCQLDFARPEVRHWARGVMDRLMRECALDWVKIDYNIDIGDDFDGAGGDALYCHIRAYYAWLDELRAAYPNLVVENCSSGGLRFDLGIIGHTHTTWLSDVVEPKPSLALGYGCTVEFTPEVCNHWMVGDKDDGTVHREGPAGWWDFMFRVPMNGQYGISSKVLDWGPELKRRAAENVALYKSIRETLAGADLYHLTPQPDHDDPRGWMAIQYVAPDRSRSAVTAYRLGGGQPSHLFRLRGLDPAKRYAVSLDGRPAGELRNNELTVTLDAEWRAAIIRLEATQ